VEQGGECPSRLAHDKKGRREKPIAEELFFKGREGTLGGGSLVRFVDSSEWQVLDVQRPTFEMLGKIKTEWGQEGSLPYIVRAAEISRGKTRRTSGKASQGKN